MAKILVIEDNHVNLKLIEFLLDSFGHQVLQARDAETGVSLARSENPDLILMDIQLPGMDGLSAIGHLKLDRVTASTKVMALTSFAMKGDEEKILAAGFDAYLAKPIQYEALQEKIDQMLKGGRR